jgi:hypothetical protein
MTDSPSKVVDLNEFKARRGRMAGGQLDLLAPESDRPDAPQPDRSDRPLTDRNLAHRARMLAHLLSARS